ncbi:hypothetical protein REPUB_Repub02eG0078100 [Reevesia pubescens]
MASRSIFSNLKRNGGDKLASPTWRRLISSDASPSFALEKPRVKPDAGSGKESLKSRVLGLKSPTESATTVLQNWVDSGHKVDNSGLRLISNILLKSRRYSQALEIMTWKETRKGLQLSAADHASKVELLIKVGDLIAAEEHFNRLSNIASQKAACLPLLNGYVKEKNIEKAEAFMSKLGALGLTLSAPLFNEMMKLYMATSQYEKVPMVIEQMTQNKIRKNALSYNLWMDACAQLSGVVEAEAVYAEMLRDENVQVGWSTMCTLANIYTKAGVIQKAVVALKTAETKLSASKRLGYIFLMTQYASLNNKVEVLRLWEASKEVGAYMRNGWVDKAESLHLRLLEKGGCPNYKTWEILTEGWMRSNNMVKAINAMKKGLAMLKDCHWRPSQSILVAIAEYFEKHGNLEDANDFFRDIQHMGLASSPIYKSWLRIHLLAKRPAHDIFEMMEKDKIEMDDEISTLVQAFDKQVQLTSGTNANAS